MAATKRTLDDAELYARREKQVPRQHPKRQRVDIPEHSQRYHLRRAQAQGPRTPLRDITPPSSIIESQGPFPGAPSSATSDQHDVMGCEDGRDTNATNESRQSLSKLIGSLNEDEAKGLLLTYASSYTPLAEAIQALVKKPNAPQAERTTDRLDEETTQPSTCDATDVTECGATEVAEGTSTDRMRHGSDVCILDYFADHKIKILLYRVKRDRKERTPAEWALYMSKKTRNFLRQIVGDPQVPRTSIQDRLSVCSALLNLAWSIVGENDPLRICLLDAVQGDCRIDAEFEKIWRLLDKREQALLLCQKQWNDMVFEEQIRKLAQVCKLMGVMPGFGRCIEQRVRAYPAWKPGSRPISTADEIIQWASFTTEACYKAGVSSRRWEDSAYECAWIIRHSVRWICSSISILYGAAAARRKALCAVVRILDVATSYPETHFGSLVLTLLEDEGNRIGRAISSLVDSMSATEREQMMASPDIDGLDGATIAAFLHDAATNYCAFSPCREAATRLVEAR